jgi:hypothetical protein
MNFESPNNFEVDAEALYQVKMDIQSALVFEAVMKEGAESLKDRNEVAGDWIAKCAKFVSEYLPKHPEMVLEWIKLDPRYKEDKDRREEILSDLRQHIESQDEDMNIAA